MEWLSRLKDLAQIPTKFVAVVAAACALVLFLPAPLLNILSVTPLRDQYGPHIGIVFLVASALLLVELSIFVGQPFRKWYRKKQQRQRIEQYCEHLDQAEKAVLREFVVSGSKSMKLPIDQPSVAALINAGILVQSSTLGRYEQVGAVFPVYLDEAAQNILTPGHLDFARFMYTSTDGETNLTAEGIEWIRDNRPNFMT